MQINVYSDLERRSQADVLILPFWQHKKGVEEAADLGRLKSVVPAPIKTKDFTAKEGEVVWIYGDEPEEKRIMLLGLGSQDSVTMERLRRSFAACSKACKTKKAAHVNIVFPHSEILSQEAVLQALLEGILLTQYSFTLLKHDTLKDEPEIVIEKLGLIGCEKKVAQAVGEHVQKVSKGVYFARDLINDNAATVTPQYLADAAKKLKKEYPYLQVEIRDAEWIKKQKMGLFLAVAQASSEPPYFIVMKYKGQPNSSDHTAIIGKGVTFDTGGLNLKPIANMETQKADMSGAAIAFGVMKAVCELELPVNVSCVVAACENAIGSKAFKPGDVYQACSGTTVEITNPDAEGRLTLADALYWTAKELKPTRMIDFATLTGSCVMALGTELFALFSNSDSLAKELLQAGERTFERGWQFPLYEEYKSQLRSDIADMKNAAGKEAGVILGAIFLQEFVNHIPWAHCDIAGVAFMKEARRYQPKYATGIGVRLIIDFLEHLMKKW